MSPPTLDLIPELPPLSQMLRAEEIHPGDVIAGKYRVRAILGRSHGLLVEAFHTEFDQRAIIKVLLAGSGDDREIERFRREARTLAKLESEHVARIIDVGTEADGSFYLVRQYLDGIDLGTYVRQSGPLALVDAVLTILQVAEAVAETHSHGIIVRELQPGHLFLTQRAGGSPLIRISDFGTAKLMKDAAAPGAGPEVTATAMFGLSPYSSPELLRKARDVDARADVWSLGAIFYELLTGHPPFSGEATYLMLQITRDEPTPPSQLRGDIPPEIDQIISWALAKDVDARFKSVHAFAHALLPYASSEGQLLVERIAQMSSSGKRRGSQPPPAFPSVRPAALPIAAQPVMAQPIAVSERPVSSRPLRGQDDSITDVRMPSSAPAVAVTMPSQVSPAAVEAHAVPPPPPGQPMGIVPSQMAAHPGSVPPPAPQAVAVPREGSAGRKAALGIIAVSAVLVPVLLILLLLKRSGGPAVPEVATTSTAIAPAVTAPVVTAPPTTTETSATPTAAETASAAPVQTAQAASVGGEPSASATADAPDTSAKASKANHTVAVHAAPPPPAPAPAPAPAAGPTGTLLAMVVGGTCAFSVNGAAKGSGQSIRVPLKPGTYSVVCRGAGGSKSKSVTVRSGETAMAAFKL